MPDDIAAADPTDTQPHLRRDLANRHIQLIAIGGAIGTGLFMGSGRTISLAGPAVMVVYGIIGFFVFFVLRAMGELLLSNLNYKSFVDFAADLLGPARAFSWGGRTGSHGWSPGSQTSSRSPAMPGFGGPACQSGSRPWSRSP